jgi:hypothetical protein
MLTAVMNVMDESIGYAGLAGNQTVALAGDNGRRNSEPASTVFDDLFDQLYNNDDPDSGREDMFADGFHSPPPETMIPVATKRSSITLGQQASRPRSYSEPPNWDLVDENEYKVKDFVDTHERFPIENKATVGQTNLLRPQPSRHLLDATTFSSTTTTGEDSGRAKHAFDPYPDEPSKPRACSEPPNWDLFDEPDPFLVDKKAAEWQTNLVPPQPARNHRGTTTFVVTTKTGEDSDQDKHAFAAYTDEPGRSRQRRSNAPYKRSRSADPVQMQSFFNDDVSYLSDDHHQANIFEYLNAEERQQLEGLGFYSREVPKRRRSEPILTEDFFSEYYGGGNESRQDMTNIFTFNPPPETQSLAETGHSRKTSDLIQIMLGGEKVDRAPRNSYDTKGEATSSIRHNGGNAADAQITQALPNHGMSSQVIDQYLPASSHRIVPIANQQTQQLLSSHGNVNAMHYNPLYTNPPMQQNMNMPYTIPNTDLSVADVQQPPQSFLNPNIPSMTSNEDELNNILDAVIETQNNLQLLQSVVAQQRDPQDVESITKAFELTAACSQFVLLSQFQEAHKLLNQAWTHIKILEDRLALSGSSASSLTESFGPSLNEIPQSSLTESLGPLRLPRKSKKKKAPKTPEPSELEDLKLELPPPCKDDPDIIMSRLNVLMERTIMSQKMLEQYDKQNGLPRSHAQTMVNSSRSRKQLQKGVVPSFGSPLVHDTFFERKKDKAVSAIENERTGASDRKLQAYGNEVGMSDFAFGSTVTHGENLFGTKSQTEPEKKLAI